MDIKVIKEDLSQWDCGGGYRVVMAEIFIDSSLSLVMQRKALVFEVLSLYLDPLEKQADLMDELAQTIAESIDQLDPPQDLLE